MEDDIPEREKFEKIPDDEDVGLEETVEQRIKRKRRWEKLCFKISAILPDVPLKQIANIVKRTWGDEELTMALLIEELTGGSTTTSTTTSTSSTTVEKETNHKDEGREKEGEKEAREKREEADHMADDFALALRLQQEWEEEEKREKGGPSPPSSTMPEGSTESDDGVYECSICMNDDCTLAEIFIVEECGHYFCKECVKEHMRIQITQIGPTEDQETKPEDAVYGVKCPHVGCDHLMDYYEISQCADPDLVKKFETFTLNRALAKLDQLVWCPKNCGSAVIVNDHSATHARCVNEMCRFTFCLACKTGHKEKWSCAKAAARRKRKAAGDRVKVPTGLSSKELRTVAGALKGGKARHCPACNTVIEKNLGCNHMTCKHCGASFDWASARWFSGQGGPQHKRQVPRRR